MKKYLLPFLLIVSVSAAAESAPAKSEKEQIADLTARNAALEAVIKDLRAQRDSVTQQVMDLQLQLSEMSRTLQQAQKKGNSK